MGTLNERQIRYRLSKKGFSLRKSRVKTINIDNLGMYMVVDNATNGIDLGERFDASLDDVISWMRWMELWDDV